ncbi:hypothetical protein G3I40_12275 [Streptomyces sp. SID14478]|uniref:DUF6248 family natural product biosynthesis protein n=1 Tax=Streptomyces sp. SID14478 TaxID=2706073 RepID=UPI0013DBE7CA|nr:DUF6248 family natural product biosynthesis protein [Streptomyces sp. SID14478]NEB75991.1 hypothetical protein [Streptomyces sp. SID14478]
MTDTTSTARSSDGQSHPAVLRRPQRTLSPAERAIVRRTPLLNLQGALIMGIVDPVPNASPMSEEEGSWVRSHVWPDHYQDLERKYPWGFRRWATCERGTCWNCLSGRCDLCVHRQEGSPYRDDNTDWLHNQHGRCIAPFIPRPLGEPCLWWCRCPCAKNGPLPAKPEPHSAEPTDSTDHAAHRASPQEDHHGTSHSHTDWMQNTLF